jgi:group I intron endonuclease
MYSIYKITNIINNKIYIGYSKNPEKRWVRHQKISTHKIKQKFHYALSKYGIDNFKFEIIESKIVSLKDALLKEKYWIHYYESYVDSTKGYNMTPGGEGGPTFCGKKHSLETKKKFSTIQNNRSEKWSENLKKSQQNRSIEWRKNISIAHQKRSPVSDETKEKMRKAWKKRKVQYPITEKTKNLISNYQKGKFVSIKQKENMSDAHKLKLLNNDIEILRGNLNKSPRILKRFKQRLTSKYWENFTLKNSNNKQKLKDLLMIYRSLNLDL